MPSAAGALRRDQHGDRFRRQLGVFRVDLVFQLLSVCHSGIPAQQPKNSSMSRMFVQISVPMMTLPLVRLGGRLGSHTEWSHR